MTSAEKNLLLRLDRLQELVGQLVARNTELQAEVDDLHDHIEGLNTKLTAAKAETFTLNQEAEPKQQLLDDAAERDTKRLERLRALLNEYLSETQPTPALPDHVNEQN